MFIIVPKYRQPEISTGVQDSCLQRPENGGVASREQTSARVPSACDSCRVKKTKCNGQHPCDLCQRKRSICVYSRPIQRNKPSLSAAQSALLQNQQRRLISAIQRMASIINRYESGTDSDPSEFDVAQLLENYAPQPSFNSFEELESDMDGSSSRARKRYRCESNFQATSPPQFDIEEKIEGGEAWPSSSSYDWISLNPTMTALQLQLDSGNGIVQSANPAGVSLQAEPIPSNSNMDVTKLSSILPNTGIGNVALDLNSEFPIDKHIGPQLFAFPVQEKAMSDEGFCALIDWDKITTSPNDILDECFNVGIPKGSVDSEGKDLLEMSD